LFATTLDVHLILGDIAENAADCDTANGRSAARTAAHDRLARMLCCDREEFTAEDALQATQFLADRQQQQLSAAIDRVLAGNVGHCSAVIVSGSGEFLALRVVAQRSLMSAAKVVSLAEQFS